MKFKEFLKSFFHRIKESISRFLMAFIFSVLLFMTFAYQIIFESNNDETIVPLCMAFAFGAVFSVLFKVAEEYFERINVKKILKYIVPLLSTFICFVLTRLNYESQTLHMVMAYTGVLIAMICFIFYILMQGEYRNRIFPKIVASMVFASAVCGVLSAGFSICIGAFQALIFEFAWEVSDKIYLIINLFVWTVVYINIFLAFIPKKDEEIQKSKIFKAFVLYAGLPLYMLLITILLLYLLKIVVTWNMPVGEINWFASFASLFFIFFLLSIMQYEEKGAKLFAKFGGFLLIPVLIMQAIAVFERISAYGLTTPRTVSLVLIFISCIFIGASLINHKHMNKVAFLSGLIVLIVTVTPFNVIDMPIKSQTRILEETLIKNNMLVDGKVIPSENVSDDDAERILSAYEYLKYDAEKLPDFIPDEEISTKEFFGIGKAASNRFYCYFYTKPDVDITEYNHMIKINKRTDAIMEFEYNGQLYNIDLYDIALELYGKYGDFQNDMELYKVNDNIALYFDYFSFGIQHDNVNVGLTFDGVVLIKD